MSDDLKLIERVDAECAMRHPTLGSVVLSVPDARRLLAMACEAERLRDLLERARYQLPGGLLGDEPNTLIDEIESALAPKEPSDA